MNNIKVISKNEDLVKDNSQQNTSCNTGIYVDFNNIKSNGGGKVQYDVLKQFAGRNGGYVNSMNIYMSKPINNETESTIENLLNKKQEIEKRITQTKVESINDKKSLLEIEEKINSEIEKIKKTNDKENDFNKIIKRMGYNIIYADTKIFEQKNGKKPIVKQNSDIMMVTDMMHQQNNIDRYLILTGDGDFSYTIKQLIKNGKLVEVIAFNNVSRDLKECCTYYSGYLIPNLLLNGKSNKNKPKWGLVGSRVRGYIHKVYGTYSFANFYRKIDDKMWIISSNHPENSLESVFIPHIEVIGENISDENRKDGCIYEFTLELNENKQPDSTKEMTDLVATKVKRIDGAFI